MKAETRNRKRMYDDQTGSTYEEARYGDPYKEQYRQIRNKALAGLISENFGKDKSLRILEVGCGTGMTLTYLATLPALHELHGMDFSQTMLSQAHQKLAGVDNPFRLAQGDSFELPYSEDVFDVIYSTRFIHQFSIKFNSNRKAIDFLNRDFDTTKYNWCLKRLIHFNLRSIGQINEKSRIVFSSFNRNEYRHFSMH